MPESPKVTGSHGEVWKCPPHRQEQRYLALSKTSHPPYTTPAHSLPRPVPLGAYQGAQATRMIEYDNLPTCRLAHLAKGCITLSMRFGRHLLPHSLRGILFPSGDSGVRQAEIRRSHALNCRGSIYSLCRYRAKSDGRPTSTQENVSVTQLAKV